MKRQHRVAWSKGMFLSSQHFQAQGQYIDDEFSFRTSVARFENWGVSTLEIDEAAVEAGDFRILKCAGLLSDGLAFSLGGPNPAPSSESFLKEFPEKVQEIGVFLAVPEHQVDGQNISQTDRPMLRFVPKDQTFFDERDGGEEIIEVASPNFRVVFGERQPSGNTAIQIARITRAGGPPALDSTFVPPCLNIGASTFLKSRVPRLVNALKVVNGRLSADRGQSDYLSDFSHSDIRRFWVLDIVNRALPELNHFYTISGLKGTEEKATDPKKTAQPDGRTRAGGVHPEELYRFLLRLAGGLCTFIPEENPLGFPDYDHQNLGACFRQVMDKIELMLKRIAYPPVSFEEIPLTTNGDGEWQGALPEALIADTNRYFLALRATDARFDLIRFADTERKIRLAGEDRYRELWLRGAPGAHLKFEHPPRGLPRSDDSKYFQIDSSSLEWEDVADTRKVHISVRATETDLPIRDFDLRMFVVFPEKA